MRIRFAAVLLVVVFYLDLLVLRGEEVRAWLFQLPLSFLMQYVKVLQIWTLSIFAICIVLCPNISLVHHVLIRDKKRTHHKLMHTRTDVKLDFHCFFFLRTSWKYLFDARWVCRVNFLFNSKIRRFPQFCLCQQLLKKKGVKWTKSDYSLLLLMHTRTKL